MIQQPELKAAYQRDREVDDLARDPAVLRYLAAKKAQESGLADLRARVGRGEEAKPGKFGLSLKHSFAVAWEKVFGLVRERPKVAAAITEDRGAQAIIAQALSKDPGASFVTERVSLSVVVTE